MISRLRFEEKALFVYFLKFKVESKFGRKSAEEVTFKVNLKRDRLTLDVQLFLTVGAFVLKTEKMCSLNLTV